MNKGDKTSKKMGIKKYRWIVCITCMMIQFAVPGLLTNSFQVFQPGLIEEFGLTNTQLSAMIEIRIIVSVLFMVVVVRYYEKLDYKKGFVIAILICALCFSLFYIAKNYIMLCIAYTFGGAAYTLAGTIPASSLMMRWFSDNTGFAVGVTAAGSGLANVICSPLFAHLMKTNSMQFCFMLQVLILIFFAIAAFLIIDVPENKYGYSIEEYAGARSNGVGGGANETTSRGDASNENIHDRRPPTKKEKGMMIAASFLVGGFIGTGFAYLTNLFVDGGIGETTVATAMSIFGAVLILSKFLYGGVSDRLGAFMTNYIFYGSAILGIIICCLAPGSPAMMFISVILMGIGFSILNVGLPVWAFDFSDPDSYPDMIRKLQMAAVVGTLVFNITVGPSVDIAGSYRFIYMIFIAVGVISCTLIQITYTKRKN